ncbi:MAG TPA: hypothetical protein VG308_08430 [Stellaceae bacterium]|nr:hypothetical protein [Stellaceae bacterium]
MTASDDATGRQAASWAPLRWLIVAIGAAKLLVLACAGPIVQPDTAAYVPFADAILDGRAFARVAWGSEALPPFVFHMAGYPLFLAAAKLVAPGAWAAVSIVAQDALSLCAMALMFRVGERILGGAGPAAAATLLYAGLASLLWDNSLLSDSLYAALFDIVMFALLGAALGCWRLSPMRVAGLAFLWGYSLWTRDSGLAFTLLPLAVLIAIGSRRAGPAWRRFGAAFGFVLGVALMVEAYRLFNLYRTGEAFLGITATANVLRPLFDMAALGYADPFAGADPLSRAVRATMHARDFPAQWDFLTGPLFNLCRCTPLQLQSLVLAAYRHAVIHFPIAYSREVLHNFAYFSLASDVADPVGAINQFVEQGMPSATPRIPGLSLQHLAALAEDFSAGRLVLMLVAGFCNVMAALLFTLFLFGVPWIWLRERPRRAAVDALAFLWLVFVGVVLGFSLLHREARHSLPVLPAAEIGIVYTVSRLAALRRQGRAG